MERVDTMREGGEKWTFVGNEERDGKVERLSLGCPTWILDCGKITSQSFMQREREREMGGKIIKI